MTNRKTKQTPEISTLTTELTLTYKETQHEFTPIMFVSVCYYETVKDRTNLVDWVDVHRCQLIPCSATQRCRILKILKIMGKSKFYFSYKKNP